MSIIKKVNTKRAKKFPGKLFSRKYFRSVCIPEKIHIKVKKGDGGVSTESGVIVGSDLNQ